MKNVMSFLLMASVIGCGGSGGGDGASSSKSFAGVWDAQMTILDNKCNIPDAQTLNTTFVVNQSENRIVVDLLNGDSVSGIAPDEFSFRALGEKSDPCSPTLPGLTSQKVEFLRGQGEGYEADKVAAFYTLQVRCGNDSVGCEVSYVGTATRD